MFKISEIIKIVSNILITLGYKKSGASDLKWVPRKMSV